jgi:hypothetical protein
LLKTIVHQHSQSVRLTPRFDAGAWRRPRNRSLAVLEACRVSITPLTQ